LFEKIKIKFSFSLLFLIYSSITFALESGIRFQHLTIEDGLPHGRITTILQDDTGFLWFGTGEGLARYDGYNFKAFKHDPNNSNSISSNVIKSIIKDSQGNLWIGTDTGLNQFNPKIQQFTHFRHQNNDLNSLSDDNVRSIVEDRKGNLWLGTSGGLNHFNPNTLQFTHYRHQIDNINSLTNDDIFSILVDQEGELWVGTNGGGLNHFNPKTKQFTHYRHQVKDSNSLSHDSIRSLLKDSQGDLWVGTRGGGLNQFNLKTQQFTHYRHQVNDSNSLTNDDIWSIFEDGQGDFWLGTYNGLNHLNIKTGKITHHLHQADDLYSLSDNDVISIVEDNQGNIWLGTYSKGVSYFNPKYIKFKYLELKGNASVWSILKDSSGNLWWGTHDGLNYLNTKTKKIISYQHKGKNSNGLSHEYVYALLEDNKGNLWAGTRDGLNHIDLKTGEFTHYFHQAKNPNSLSNNDVSSLLEDKHGNLWVGTSDGLNHFDLKSEKFTHYRQQASNPNSLSNNDVWSILEDSQGNLWIGTNGGGLNHFNTKTQKFTQYRHQENDPNSLIHDEVESILEDSHGNLWVGTTQGLNLFDNIEEKFTRYTTANGLPNNVIYRIEEDKRGYIWLSTNNGLSRLTPKTAEFKNYDIDHGLQSNEFNSGSSFISKNGELFFGGIKGFNRFYPENIIDDMQLPKVVITEMLLLNESVPVIPLNDVNNNKKHSTIPLTRNTTSFSLTQVINKTKAITLTYQENIVAFEFSALHFLNPKKNQYAYQLVGWDKKWVSTDYKNRRATYTNLPYGDYTFRVKASNADGYWNEQGASLKVTLLPPPWKTWWAYTLYGIFLVSLVLAFVYSQRKKVIFERNVNAQLEDKVVERTSQLEYKAKELQKSNMLLEEMSLTDQLTGLKNRRFLLNNVESDIRLVLRKYKSSHESESKNNPSDADLIFFLIDLDHFKMVNDIHGHTAGDAVLLQIKVILEQVFRETDYLVRWGGEEFLVIARFTERSNGPELAERLRQAVETHSFNIGDEKVLKKTCSIGFACFPFLTEDTEALTWEQVVDVADHCMYAAKKSSRNAWVGLYNKTNARSDDLFTAVIDQTHLLIQSDELKVLSSIADVDQVNW